MRCFLKEEQEILLCEMLKKDACVFDEEAAGVAQKIMTFFHTTTMLSGFSARKELQSDENAQIAMLLMSFIHEHPVLLKDLNAQKRIFFFGKDHESMIFEPRIVRLGETVNAYYKNAETLTNNLKELRERKDEARPEGCPQFIGRSSSDVEKDIYNEHYSSLDKATEMLWTLIDRTNSLMCSSYKKEDNTLQKIEEETVLLNNMISNIWETEL